MSLALTLKEGALQDDGPQIPSLRAPVLVDDSQLHLPREDVLLGAQPHSISYMVENTNATVVSGRAGSTVQEADPSDGLGADSEESSGFASDSLSGDENAVLSNSLDRPCEIQNSEGLQRSARYCATSPLKLGFSKTCLTAGPTLAESELDGMV